MIVVMDESHENMLGVRASGKLTTADYDRILAPHLEALWQRFDRLRALLYRDDAFQDRD